MTAPGWRWLWRGDLPATAMELRFEDAPARLPAAMRLELAADWKARLAAAERDGLRLFEAPMAQLLSFEVADGAPLLRLGRSCYSHWLFSSGRQDEIEQRFGAGTASRPLALCAALRTADGCVVVQERSAAVAEGAGLLHVVGGHLDPDEHRRDGIPAPDVAMRAELAEELGLGEGDLRGGRLLGLGESRENGKPEMLYLYETVRRREELRQMAENARDGFEFARIRFVSVGEGALGAWLEERREERFAAPGLALLRLLAERGE